MIRNYLPIITTIALGILLFFLLKKPQGSDISFYGFAESYETEINYNYPVVVDRIMVQPGQKVREGDTLVCLSRKERNEELQDQEYKIAILRAEEALWLEKKRNEMRQLEADHYQDLKMVDTEIAALRKKMEDRRSLAASLKTIRLDTVTYKPLEFEHERLLVRRENIISEYTQRMEGVKSEIRKGIYPYQSQVTLLNAEAVFDETQKTQQIVVLAPEDGLIGTVSCKEEEHIPSFKTLLTFYEPHSHIVKGYVHEDLIMQVKINDQFTVSSLKEENIQYDGSVIGLGSRVVEIPSRLRKIPDFKTYGREVLVEISPVNQFLQKEKVALYFKE